MSGARPVRRDETWAFFDFDGTLIRGDSFLPFLAGWLRRHPGRVPHLARIPFSCAVALTRGAVRTRVKEALLSAFLRGARRDAVLSRAAEFWPPLLAERRNEATFERLDWHRREGHRIAVVTASFDFYMERLRELLPVDAVIATRAEWAQDALTGRIAGANCRGEEKLRRIRADLGFDPAEVTSYAYGDSDGDLPLLRHARYPFRVRSSTITPWLNPRTPL